MREVYLDNSATTRVCESAAQKAVEAMTVNYGNPSSLHSLGVQAEQYIRSAKASISRVFGASSDELIFTSGGTESNNLAIFGAAAARCRMGKRIVTTAIEHHSVLHAVNELAHQGFEIVTLRPDSSGHISEESIYEAVNSDTILVSMMLVNNEIGSILPVSAAARAIKRAKAPALLHCDAVQAFGKMPFKVSSLGCDLLSVTAHKIHGPKGVGALYIKKGTRILPRQFGGEQQKRIRPGTEPVPLIAAFGEAVEQLPDYDAALEYMSALREHLIRGLESVGGITINSPADALPYIVNFRTGRIRSEIMLHHLSASGIYCSSGSACAKGEPSHVLSAMGLSNNAADTSLRVSFSRHTTTEDIDLFLDALRDGMNHLKY